ncbi:MAG: acylphosphatase [Chloroflexi bacterium]|nr:acylphosphatase [Chloroflexota bacterium]
MPSQAALHALVRGRVQGVFFRAFVRQKAQELGLLGFVRNREDARTVEVQAEGERKQLEQLLEALRTGPPGARVEEVEASWGEPAGSYQSFEIRY